MFLKKPVWQGALSFWKWLMSQSNTISMKGCTCLQHCSCNWYVLKWHTNEWSPGASRILSTAYNLCCLAFCPRVHLDAISSLCNAHALGLPPDIKENVIHQTRRPWHQKQYEFYQQDVLELLYCGNYQHGVAFTPSVYQLFIILCSLVVLLFTIFFGASTWQM